MKKFAYLNYYGVVGSVLWYERGLYKISFFHDNQSKIEVFISNEIKLRDTDGFEEMGPSEIKRYVKSGKLREKEVDSFINVISKLERSDIFIILENLKSANPELCTKIRSTLEASKTI
jgi:hypothetical protein